MKQRADSHIITTHALNIVNIDGRDNRQKAIALFSDRYDLNSTNLLKEKIKELFPFRKKAKK